MFLKYKCLIILLLFLTGNMMTEAQELIAPTDTVMAVVGDTLVPAGQDSVLALDSVPKKQTGLDAPVTYQAKDSIIMTGANWAYLFGESDVKYQQIELQSEKIEMNMDSSLVYATFGLDSIGEEFGYPLFKDGDQQYESKTMRYNFGTKKGYITDVITQQGEGYVTAGRTKKMDNDVLNMVGGRYTTCDEHDHPHFYIQMTKAKVLSIWYLKMSRFIRSACLSVSSRSRVLILRGLSCLLSGMKVRVVSICATAGIILR